METKENGRPKKKIIPFIFALIVLLAAGYGIKKYLYGLNHEDTDDAQLESNIIPVIPRISGYITEITFNENQLVHQGQLLIRLDDRDLQVKEEQAKAALDNAIANLSVAKANFSTAQTAVETAKATAESANIKVWKTAQDYTRYQNLLNDKSVTQQQFESIKADKETSEAQAAVSQKQILTATAQLRTAEEQVSVAQSQIKQREADLNYANLQLSYAAITAPATGITSRKSIQPGQYVQTGQPLFSIVADSSIWVVANFKETQLEKMKVGQKAEISVDAYHHTTLNGEIESFSSATGARFALLPPDNATGNFVKVVQRIPVKIIFKDDKARDMLLRPGMNAKVIIDIN
jgi:membrane fusion protein (multidrug efflux system)